MRLYAIYDTVARAIVGGVHVCQRDEVAIRLFGDVASDNQTMIARHPSDYELLYLGELGDGAAGICVPTVAPVVVLTGAALLALRDDSVQAENARV